MKCPEKGRSPARQFDVTLAAKSETRAAMKGLGFNPSKQKWFAKFRSEPSLYHEIQRWMRRVMSFDKRTDRYEEEVTNPETGEVVYRRSEPLSQHVGHGSAKQRPPQK